MRKALCYFSAAALALSAMAGCGDSSNNSTNSNEVPVVVTVHDAPLTGVTVVSFSVQVTGITLQGSGSANVSLLSSPVTVQLQNLGTTSEILAQSSAPEGTYSGMMVTYSTPSMTFQNSSGSTQTVGTTTCTTGSFCSVTPTLNQMSTTVTTTPFPLTLTKGQPVNIAIDFNIGSSIQSNLSVSPAISVTASTTPLADTNLADITGITGQITNVGSNSFKITDTNTGQNYTVNTGTSTQYQGFSSCTAANFSCLSNNQIATVNLGISDTNPTTLTASTVNLENGFTNSVTGTVVAVNKTNGTFQVVANNEVSPVTGITNGQVYTVTPGAGATYGVAAGTPTAPSGYSFTGINNIGPGQTITFAPGTVTGSNIATNNILLSNGMLSGNVSGVSGNNVTINGLNGIYTGAGTTSITAYGGTNTTYLGVTGTSGLVTGNPVNLGGTLYYNGTTPAYATGQVAYGSAL